MNFSWKTRWFASAAVATAGAALAVALTLGTGAAGAAGPAATTTTGSTTTAGTTTAASKPDNTQPPTISGTPEEGQKLVGHRGTWTGKPTDYNDRWVRCDKNGASCANISGATNRNGYVLTSADVGNTIRFKVEAKNAGGSTFASSAPTAVIKVASSTPPPASNGCPSKKSGSNAVSSISPPARLLIDQTEINPSNVTYSTNSITLRFHVSACGGSVAGALVYATAVPYNQFSIPNEQTTDANGWATLQMSRLGGYPASSKQQLLVMFARARKPGEPLLSGISTRRLVSFHVTR
jgi:hypothetical protein